MKTKTILLAFFVTLLSVSNILADPPNPCVGDDCPPDLVETSIDENITLFVVAALVLGIILIYKNKIKKASV
ncbi:hypothetical protein [Flavobacterium aquidurense]|uniref:hypothetical protein n=1 Tax=Flavobacterium aquidurense TaxID=362413 RepID=UPI002862DE03|nr:hypothetical protein [Flavobacterium aquidurense]MDR7372594.1 hypothetical protein [Flavobacterium aquidurense]